MAEQFHYPPEVSNLLVDTVPLLCRSKKDVVLFFQGAGVAQDDLAEVARIVQSNPGSINKYDIVRNVLTKVNARGDSGLSARREIIKRIVEFEEFSTCWPNDQLKAKGLVADLRKIVNVKDSFTRMKQERDAEREQVLARQRAEQAAAAEKRAKIEYVSKRLFALFSMDDKPQERGKLLEAVLNDLFKAYGIQVREDFRRKSPDTGTVLEQIDGVIELDGAIHLVEMKWLNMPVGMGEFSPHLSRLFLRANAHGIFIATNGYTEPVLAECKNALNLKTIFLCSLQEFVMLLQRQGDLVALLKKKSQAAIIDKNPYLEVLS
ncbi:Restriction endonuclease [Azotobacter beijerinckii]|uniref:Restriction endonuclease n=1 Tax=Azotobacter beijerinckii TaxID=170623 RepID=A0A1H6STE6_9GAMM|nr:restriction endonuclease [Azotobacter beijerinckii]SEI66852.1 Restriction endonuclease [Azotobacter beijerinckii]